ncbi:MAG: PD40 domain-containing protein [Melioribacteraceae bacterium]|nr:PD40 domain-containing protein [Melioribacteraceae bacterium]
MRKVILILFLMTMPVISQKVTVIKNNPVTNLTEGKFYYPQVNPDGKSIIFSSENRKGLWLKNINDGNTLLITDALGAGYEPGFSSNNELIFRHDRFNNGRRISSLVSYNIISRRSSYIENGIRDLRICKNENGLVFSFLKDSNLPVVVNKNVLQKSNYSLITAYAQNNSLIVTDGRVKKTIQPFGVGHYLWPSISPNRNLLLFTFAGKGAYITDLNGAIIKKLGYANYPSFSPDGNWVLFMKDIDDGVEVISSNIHIVNIKSGKYFNLTVDQDHIAMYPRWGITPSEIYYNTYDGEIRKIELKIE